MSSLLKVEAGYYRCDWQGDINVTIMTAKLECNKRLKDSVHDALMLRNRIGWLYMEHVLALFLGHLLCTHQQKRQVTGKDGQAYKTRMLSSGDKSTRDLYAPSEDNMRALYACLHFM